jgi:hypothetical protein
MPARTAGVSGASCGPRHSPRARAIRADLPGVGETQAATSMRTPATRWWATLARSWAVLALTTAALVTLGPPAPARATTAAPVLASPQPGTVHTRIPVSYSLPDPPAPGSVELVFTGATTCTVSMSTARAVLFSIDPSSVRTSSAEITGTTCANLNEGSYNLTLRYRAVVGGAPQPVASTTAAAVQVRAATPPPIVSAPLPGSAHAVVPVAYRLPVTAATDTVSVTFLSAETGATICTLTMGTAPQVSFTLDPAAVAASSAQITASTCTTLPDGLYTMLVRYRPAGSSAAAFGATSVGAVRISTAGAPPVVTAPAAGDALDRDSSVSVTATFPDPAVAGTTRVILTPQDGTPCTLTVADGPALGLWLDVDALGPGAGVTSSTCTTIPDGPLSLRVAYRSAVTGLDAHTTVTGLRVGRATTTTLIATLTGDAGSGSVRLDATVRHADGTPPAGTVVFEDRTGAPLTLATVPLLAGAATTTAVLPTGPRVVVATYAPPTCCLASSAAATVTATAPPTTAPPTTAPPTTTPPTTTPPTTAPPTTQPPTTQPPTTSTVSAPTGSSVLGTEVCRRATGAGYWLVTAAGEVHAFGAAPPADGVAAPAHDVTAIAASSDGGYWVLTATGRVHARGGAPDLGSVPAGRLARSERATTIAATPDGAGYWVFTNRGRVVPFGTAGDHGDASTLPLTSPIVASAATSSGRGYHLIAADGGVFAYGDARFHGSMGGHPLNAPVVGMTSEPCGDGYWLVAADGGVFAFNAPFRGSIPGVLIPGQRLNQPVIGVMAYGDGYAMVAADGGVFVFSDLPFVGSRGSDPPAAPVVGLAVLPG